MDDTNAMILTTIPQNRQNNAGDLISAIIASAGGDPITDADGDPEGIAIIDAPGNGQGAWQYFPNTMNNWSNVNFGGNATETNARLLEDGMYLRFRPNNNLRDSTSLSIPIVLTITFRAWDRTDGANGDRGNSIPYGDDTAYSIVTTTATIVIRPNRAPVVPGSCTIPFPPITEDPNPNNGILVSNLIIIDCGVSDAVTDPDSDPLGIAVTEVNGNGKGIGNIEIPMINGKILTIHLIPTPNYWLVMFVFASTQITMKMEMLARLPLEAGMEPPVQIMISRMYQAMATQLPIVLTQQKLHYPLLP